MVGQSSDSTDVITLHGDKEPLDGPKSIYHTRAIFLNLIKKII